MSEETLARRPALFLDRDGVINLDPGYLHRIEDVRFIDGIFDLVRWAVGRSYVPVIVTNQSGIGRGYFTEQQFNSLMRWMCRRFEEEGAPIAAVYYCPYHPEGVGVWRKVSPDRKPNPGMLLRARDDLGLDLSASVLIGDQDTDLLAGRNAGVGRVVAFGSRADRRLADVVAATMSDLIAALEVQGHGLRAEAASDAPVNASPLAVGAAGNTDEVRNLRQRPACTVPQGRTEGCEGAVSPRLPEPTAGDATSSDAPPASPDH